MKVVQVWCCIRDDYERRRPKGVLLQIPAHNKNPNRGGGDSKCLITR